MHQNTAQTRKALQKRHYLNFSSTVFSYIDISSQVRNIHKNRDFNLEFVQKTNFITFIEFWVVG